MYSIAVLVTCHNRRHKTATCLNALREAATAVDGLQYQVYLTDDGSTDGTDGAVAGLGVPLTIIRGNGQLYWNRGMAVAWQAALKSGRAFDAYLLLNDDTVMDTAAIGRLIEASIWHNNTAIIVGATRDPETGTLTYGGVRRTSSWHPARTALIGESESLQLADTFNGNCVLVPERVRKAVGILDGVFTHGMGDFDYGLRANRLGVPIVVAPGTAGTCGRNSIAGTWRDSTLSLARRLELLESPKGLPRKEWQVYLARHGAPFPWLMSWLPRLSTILSALLSRAKR